MESTSGHIGLEANHEITGEPLLVPSYNLSSSVIIHRFALWEYYSDFAISVTSSKQSARIIQESLVLRIIEPTIYATCQFLHSGSHCSVHITCCNIIICKRNLLYCGKPFGILGGSMKVGDGNLYSHSMADHP